MQIWIYLNGMQQGPYTYQQLQTMAIEPTTPVWYDGLPQWMPASEAPATASLFRSIYEPSEAEAAGQMAGYPASGAETERKRPSTYLVWNIVFTVLCCCPLSLAGIITGAISSSRYTAGDYEGAKKMSEVTAWLLILSIVWALLSLPLAIVWGLF